MASAEDWTCPICLELVYRPCVNSCGHVFCFWCMHKAMSMFETSKCPSCRSTYSYFPRVCETLHQYISDSFPEEHTARARVAAEEEHSMNATSPEEKTGGAGTLVAAGPRWKHYLQERFTCAHPGCRNLLYRPTVLTCGHMVCLDSCAHDDSCAPIPKCPACGERTSDTPKLCNLVHELLQQQLPEEQAQRLADTEKINEIRASAMNKHKADSTSSEQRSGMILERLRNSGEVTDRGMRLLDAMSTHFVHHGVGCDQCGQFPIVGDRFRCVDCCEVEHMGFDLCGHCMADVDPESIRGRFNQSHTPNHRMEKVDKQLSIIHMFQALNPDIPMPELMRMVSMQFQSESDPPDSSGQSAASAGVPHEEAASQEDVADHSPPRVALTHRRSSIRREEQRTVDSMTLDMLFRSIEDGEDEDTDMPSLSQQPQPGPTSPSASLGSPILSPPSQASSGNLAGTSTAGMLPMFRRQQLYRRTQVIQSHGLAGTNAATEAGEHAGREHQA